MCSQQTLCLCLSPTQHVHHVLSLRVQMSLPGWGGAAESLPSLSVILADPESCGHHAGSNDAHLSCLQSQWSMHYIFNFWPGKKVDITGLFLTLGRRVSGPQPSVLGSMLWGGCSIPLGEHQGLALSSFRVQWLQKMASALHEGWPGAFVPGLRGTLGAGAHQDFAQGQGKSWGTMQVLLRSGVTLLLLEQVFAPRAYLQLHFFPGAAGLHQFWNHCCAEEGLREDQESASWAGWHFQMGGKVWEF